MYYGAIRANRDQLLARAWGVTGNWYWRLLCGRRKALGSGPAKTRCQSVWRSWPDVKPQTVAIYTTGTRAVPRELGPAWYYFIGILGTVS